MHHIFLIHSSVKGHLGCFQILAMTINAAMNIVEHNTFKLTFSCFLTISYMHTIHFGYPLSSLSLIYLLILYNSSLPCFFSKFLTLGLIHRLFSLTRFICVVIVLEVSIGVWCHHQQFQNWTQSFTSATALALANMLVTNNSSVTDRSGKVF